MKTQKTENVIPLDGHKNGETASSSTNLANTNTDTTTKANQVRFSALIVDDNPNFQKLLALSLSAFPKIAEIDFADNGEMAIQMASAKRYDLIFIDAMMPEMDGYEALGHLRENPWYHESPIVMVSGLDSAPDETKGILAGSTSYLTKPLQQKPFKELVFRLLDWLEYIRQSDDRFRFWTSDT